MSGGMGGDPRAPTAGVNAQARPWLAQYAAGQPADITPPHANMLDVLAARSRDAAAPTFSPAGLYFLGPVYDEKWGLPTRVAAYDWLP